MLIDLDKHEMFWLLESAARGSHLRQGLWNKFIDNVFHKLGVSEIRFLHDQCKEKLSKLYPNEKAVGYEDFQRFLARFDIDNNLYRVKVTNPDTGKKETHYAYRFNSRYFVTSSRYIGEEYILMVEEVPYNIGDKMLSKLIKELSVF